MVLELSKMTDKLGDVNMKSAEIFGKINTRLGQFDIDSFMSKKGLFNKKTYINLYDIYLAYYRTSMEISPLVDTIDEIKKTLEEDISLIDDMINEYPEKQQASTQELEKVAKELQEVIEEMETLELTEGNNDYYELMFVKDRLANKEKNIRVGQAMTDQEQMQLLLLKKTNIQVLDTISKVVEISIPIWKNQVKSAIDIISTSNELTLQRQSGMNKGLTTGQTTKKAVVTKDSETAVEKAKEAGEQLKKELEDSLK